MSNITIGRYDDQALTERWAGWIEGEDTAGTSWIVYLDGSGRPAAYWPQREANGAVTGEPITL